MERFRLQCWGSKRTSRQIKSRHSQKYQAYKFQIYFLAKHISRIGSISYSRCLQFENTSPGPKCTKSSTASELTSKFCNTYVGFKIVRTPLHALNYTVFALSYNLFQVQIQVSEQNTIQWFHLINHNPSF